MCKHSIDDLLPHAPLHYAATGEMVKGSLVNKINLQCTPYIYIYIYNYIYLAAFSNFLFFMR